MCIVFGDLHENEPKKRLPFPWHPSVKKKKLEMAVVEQLGNTVFTQGAAGEYSVHTRSCWGIQCSHKELLGNTVFTQGTAGEYSVHTRNCWGIQCSHKGCWGIQCSHKELLGNSVHTRSCWGIQCSHKELLMTMSLEWK